MTGRHGALGVGAAVAVAALALAACHPTPRRASGLQEIQDSGELRVLVRPGFPLEGSASDGEIGEADLLRQLASRLGVEVHWVEAPRHDQLLRWLEEGRGDLSVGRFSPARLAGSEASATLAINWVVDQLVMAAGPVAPTLDELAGSEVHVSRSMLREDLAARLTARGLVIRQVPEEVPIEEILRRVSLGRYRLTVADSGVVEGVPGLQVVAALSPRRPLVWAARAANGPLLRAVDDFLFAQQVLGSRRRRRPAVTSMRCSKRACCASSPATTRPPASSSGAASPASSTVSPAPSPACSGSASRWSFRRPRSTRCRGSSRGSATCSPCTSRLRSRTRARFWWPGRPTPSSWSRCCRRGRRCRRQSKTWPASRWRRRGRWRRCCAQLAVEPAIDVVTPTPGFDGPAAIRSVSRGRIGVAVVDEDIARLELAGRNDLRLGPGGAAVGAAGVDREPIVAEAGAPGVRVPERGDAVGPAAGAGRGRPGGSAAAAGRGAGRAARDTRRRDHALRRVAAAGG